MRQFLSLVSVLIAIKCQYWMIWMFYIEKKEDSKHIVGE